MTLWLVVLDRTTLAPLVNDNGSHGILQPVCSKADVTTALNRLNQVLSIYPLVIVNTLTNRQLLPAPAGGASSSYLGVFSGLNALGFPTGDMSTLDPATYALSGVGSLGWTPGDATSVGEPVGDDYAATNGVLYSTTASVDARLDLDSNGNYALLRLDEVTISRGYSGSGIMWNVTSSQQLTTGPIVDAIDPMAWTLTVLSGATLGVTKNANYEPSAARTLAADLMAAAQVRGNVILLRTSGAGNQWTGSSLRVLANAVSNIGGTYESVQGLGLGSQYSFALAGGDPTLNQSYLGGHANGQVITRTEQPFVIGGGIDPTGDPTTFQVELGRRTLGNWWEPVQVGSGAGGPVPAAGDPGATDLGVAGLLQRQRLRRSRRVQGVGSAAVQQLRHSDALR